MNISGGKDLLKFFSKNKKGVSVPEEYEKKFPNADTKRIRKDNIVVHSSGICADGKFYNTENARFTAVPITLSAFIFFFLPN
jgi:hypothetical protein